MRFTLDPIPLILKKIELLVNPRFLVLGNQPRISLNLKLGSFDLIKENNKKIPMLSDKKRSWQNECDN